MTVRYCWWFVALLSHSASTFEKLPLEFRSNNAGTIHSQMRELRGVDCQIHIIRSSLLQPSSSALSTGEQDLYTSLHPLITYSDSIKASHFNFPSSDPHQAWFAWSQKAKRLVKHGNHCSNLIILQPTEETFRVECGNPAVDNYFLVMQTEKSPRGFLESVRPSLEKIKFKFLVTPLESKTNSIYEMHVLLSSTCSHFIQPKIDSTWLAKFGTRFIILGKHLHGSVFFTPDNIIVNSSGHTVGGSHSVFIQTMSEKFNFTYDLHHTRHDQGSGHLLPNGTWTGFMGDLVYKKKDFATTVIPLESRYGFVDVTSYYDESDIVFFTRRSGRRMNLKALVHPFTSLSWSLIGMVSAVICVLVYMSLFSRTKHHSILSLLTQSLIISLAPALDQSVRAPVQSRRVLLAWLIPLFMLGSVYKSKVTEILTIPKRERIPRSFQKLYDLEDYSVYFFDLGSTPSIYFANTASERHRAIAARFQHIRNAGQCMIQAAITERSVCIGLYNVLAAAMAANLTVSNQGVPMAMSQDKVVPIYRCIGLQKNSIYTATFDVFTTMSRDTGLWGKWREDNFDMLKSLGMHWMSNDMKDSELRATLVRMRKERRIATRLRLKHFSAVFGIVGAGVLFALIVYITEVTTALINRLWYHLVNTLVPLFLENLRNFRPTNLATTPPAATKDP